MTRQDFRLIGAETPAGADGDEDWMITYLDVLTLMLALFVLLLSFSEIRIEQDEDEQEVVVDVTRAAPAGSDSELSAPAAEQVIPLEGSRGLLPAHTALLPYQQQLEQRVKALNLHGVDATPTPEGVTLRIDDNLLFDSARAELTPQGKAVISQLQQVLETFDGEISVEGHTDSLPIRNVRFPSNWELSSARAISVLRFLQENGIPQERMRAIGYADTRPLQANDTAEGRAANRRVELLLREAL